jgi:hypothetical protein
MNEVIFKDNTLKLESVFITKDIATELLDKNASNNRKINKKVTASYARQMLTGLWQSASGESIKVTRKTPEHDEELIDGQHRLVSVLEAIEIAELSELPDDEKFKGIEMLIVRGVPREAMATIDDNFKRTLSDSFAIAGMTVKNQSVINGALTVLMTLRSSAILDRHYDSVRSVNRISNAEMLEFFDKLPNFSLVCAKYFKTFRHARLSKSLTSGVSLALYYLFHDHNPVACFSVFKTLDIGIPQDGQGEKSPAFHLYNRARLNREMKVYMRPSQHILNFIWAYEKTIAKGGVGKIPTLSTWDWVRGEGEVVIFARNKLIGVEL